MKKRDAKLHDKQAEKLRRHAKTHSDKESEDDSGYDSWSGEKKVRTVKDKNKGSLNVSPRAGLLEKKKRDLDTDFLAFDANNESAFTNE